jgi:plasmid stability protein
MPTLILENVPPDVYARLQQRAASRRQSVPEETLQLLRHALQQDPEFPPGPELIPNQELSAPCDLPMPGPGVQVTAQPGEPPLPDLVGLPPE